MTVALSAMANHPHVWRHVERVGWSCWLCPRFAEQYPELQVYVDPYELAEVERQRKLDEQLAHAPTGGGRTRGRAGGR